MLGALAAGVAAWSAASAQDLEEIIVTAERREMALQDTPISVIAFTGETLEYKGVRDMFELAGTTPNLDIKGSRGTGNTSPNYQIRGIGGGGGATGERGVGFYIDNVFMPRTTGPVMRVLDVERIEVLRGPQGTLFGRNSTGGAIRVFSRQPSNELDGYLKLTGGNFDHRDVSAMINVPITDRVYFRAQAASLEQDGYVRRGPQMLGDSEDTVVRLQTAWHPSHAVSVTTGLLRTDSESNGSPTDMVRSTWRPPARRIPRTPTSAGKATTPTGCRTSSSSTGSRVCSTTIPACCKTTSRCRTSASSTAPIPTGTTCACSGARTTTRSSTST
ncbi:MAG TPA: TonB-dependent receptor plug domain-containing protein [Gammaproteobacteria bacterium]